MAEKHIINIKKTFLIAGIRKPVKGIVIVVVDSATLIRNATQKRQASFTQPSVRTSNGTPGKPWRKGTYSV